MLIFFCSHAGSILYVLRAILTSNGFGEDTIRLKKITAITPGRESRAETCLVLCVHNGANASSATAQWHCLLLPEWRLSHTPSRHAEQRALEPRARAATAGAQQQRQVNVNVLAGERDSYHTAPATWISFHFFKLLLQAFSMKEIT